jgi:hypothetical protein
MTWRLFKVAVLLSGLAVVPAVSAAEYSAITESELLVDLVLSQDGAAELVITVVAIEDGEEDNVTIIRGTWTMTGDERIFTTEDHRTIRYRHSACLDWAYFGFEGCSDGLVPVAASDDGDWWFARHPLWNRASLDWPLPLGSNPEFQPPPSDPSGADR